MALFSLSRWLWKSFVYLQSLVQAFKVNKKFQINFKLVRWCDSINGMTLEMLYCLYEVFWTLIGWDLVSFWVSPARSRPVQCPEWVELKPNKGTQVATYQGLELGAWIISTWSWYFRLLTHSRTQIRVGSDEKRGKENVLVLAKYIKPFCCQEIPIRWSLSQISRFCGIISQPYYGQNFNMGRPAQNSNF